MGACQLSTPPHRASKLDSAVAQTLLVSDSLQLSKVLVLGEKSSALLSRFWFCHYLVVGLSVFNVVTWGSSGQ